MSAHRRRQAEEGGDKQSFVLMKRLLACLLLLLSVSCVTDDDYWTFRYTRTVWDEDDWQKRRPSGETRRCETERGGTFTGDTWTRDTWSGGSGEALAALGVVFIVVPLAIDIVLLPITLTHDLMYVY